MRVLRHIFTTWAATTDGVKPRRRSGKVPPRLFHRNSAKREPRRLTTPQASLSPEQSRARSNLGRPRQNAARSNAPSSVRRAKGRVENLFE